MVMPPSGAPWIVASASSVLKTVSCTPPVFRRLALRPTTPRDWFPSMLEHSCPWKPLSSCGTTRPPGGDGGRHSSLPRFDLGASHKRQSFGHRLFVIGSRRRLRKYSSPPTTPPAPSPRFEPRCHS